MSVSDAVLFALVDELAHHTDNEPFVWDLAPCSHAVYTAAQRLVAAGLLFPGPRRLTYLTASGEADRIIPRGILTP